RVLDAMRRLDYRPHAAASVLRRPRVTSVGLLVEDVADPFYAQVQGAIEEVAVREEWALLAVSSRGSAERARHQLTTLAARGIDGLILALPDEGDDVQVVAGQRLGTPLVFFDRPARGLAGDTVVTDSALGASLAVDHLRKRGHTRIACFTDRMGLHTARERLSGYRSALAGAGIPYDPRLVHARDDPSDDRAGVSAMLALPEPPTAVFTGNNRLTVRILRHLRDFGARLDLVGFDDLELAELLSPPLTVVAQRPQEIGRRAAEAMASRLSGAAGPDETIVVEPVLIDRS
ncbi:MAG: LacI family DNA-binding transcriptional regulator, partial [Microbacterium sp.]